MSSFVVETVPGQDKPSCTSVRVANRVFKTAHVVASAQCMPSTLPSEAVQRSVFARACLITDGPLLKKGGENVAIITVPPMAVSNPTRVSIVCTSGGTSVCPAGQHVVHLTAEGTSNTPRADLEALVKSLTRTTDTLAGEADDAPGVVKEAACPKLLWASYFKRSVADVPVDHEAIPGNVLVCKSSGDGDLHFEDAIEEAQRLFEVICPNDEFLPKAPDPEDLVWDDGTDADADDATDVEAATAAADAAAPAGGGGDVAATQDAPSGNEQHQPAPGARTLHTLSVEPCEPQINVECFAAGTDDITVHFQMIRMDKSCYVWASLTPRASSCAVAMPTRFTDLPTAMSLSSESADVNAKAMALRLAKRTKQQWFVSCSLPADSERLYALVEKRILKQFENESA